MSYSTLNPQLLSTAPDAMEQATFNIDKSDLNYYKALTDSIAEKILRKKPDNLEIIDLRQENRTEYDFKIVVRAQSGRHVSAIGRDLITELKHFYNYKQKSFATEGIDKGNWGLIDLDRLLIHILSPEYYEIYNIQDIWRETPEDILKNTVVVIQDITTD